MEDTTYLVELPSKILTHEQNSKFDFRIVENQAVTLINAQTVLLNGRPFSQSPTLSKETPVLEWQKIDLKKSKYDL